MNRDEVIEAAVLAGFCHRTAFNHADELGKYAAAVRAATREEDVLICEEMSSVYEKAKKTHPPKSIEHARCEAKAYACFSAAQHIKASK